jgi:putative sigma-54 modulation protein
MNERILVSGIHVSLTPALKDAIESGAEKLLAHHPHIVRVRVDLEHDQTKAPDHRFIAKGHVEISGPDLIASAVSDDGYKSIDLLMVKLEELLRRRHQKRANTRNDERRQVPDVLNGG